MSDDRESRSTLTALGLLALAVILSVTASRFAGAGVTVRLRPVRLFPQR